MPIKRMVDKHVRILVRQDELVKEYREEHGMTEGEVFRRALDEFLRRAFPDRFVTKRRPQ